MRIILLAFFGFLSGCLVLLPAQIADGIASHYGDSPRFDGASTSTGEPFDRNGFTAACKVFPYGTVLRVTNKENGLSTQVRVNDCGPHREDRIIDLSSAAAASIGLVGLGPVRLEVITLGTQGPTCNRGAWSRAGRPPFQIDLSAFPVKGGIVNNTGTLPNSGNSTPPRRQSSTSPPVAPTTAIIRPPTAPSNPTVEQQSARGIYPPAAPTTPTVESRIQPPTAPATPTVEQQAGSIQPPTAPAAPSTYTPTPSIGPSAELVQGAQAEPEPESGVESAPPVVVEELPVTSINPNQEASPQYAVQIAAFGRLSNATEMIRQLEAAGFEGAFAVKGGNIYRVFSKPVSFRAQADYWKEQLQAAGFSGQIRRIR